MAARYITGGLRRHPLFFDDEAIRATGGIFVNLTLAAQRGPPQKGERGDGAKAGVSIRGRASRSSHSFRIRSLPYLGRFAAL